MQLFEQRSCKLHSLLQIPHNGINDLTIIISQVYFISLKVAWGWDLRSCKEMCTNRGEEDERCCIQPCLYRKLGMLKENDMRIYWRGISQSFLLSVGNDSQWVEPVTSSCEECHKKNLPIRNASDCEVIPIQIYTIINCAYNTIYFKCPPWNPHNLKECDYTRDYIRDCF